MKNERSMPNSRSKMNPPQSGPSIAPSVLQKVATPAVLTDVPNSSFTARPTIVNATPDSSDTGNIRNMANATDSEIVVSRCIW